MHLYTLHKITELTYHPEREFLLQKFIINEENAEALCRTCKRVIVYDIYLVKNHFHKISRKKSSIYQNAVNTVKGRDILNKYFISDSETVPEM